jgi:hypothetical protein
MFDRWDHTLQDGNDTESNLVTVVLCVGVGLVAAGAMLRRVRPSLSYGRIHRALSVFVPHGELALILPIPYSSPPTTLRV